MRSDSGNTVSVWMDTTKMPTFPSLEEDLSCDVCIVGAGIVGLTTAYHLVNEGADVVVLDDGPVCGGETSRTTAHLSCVLDDRFQWLERVHGERARARVDREPRSSDRPHRDDRPRGKDRVRVQAACRGICC